MKPGEHRFTIVVGSGGVGKTTLAAALALRLADDGHRTLVMTFDPSLRLKDALGVDAASRGEEVEVVAGTAAPLFASLLDAKSTFDRLVARYATDENARRRILDNRVYHHLAGRLAGILEYMAVERLHEVAEEGRYDRIVLDTPPTYQALDFLEAPERIVAFLDSGALRIALKPWFDDTGHLRMAKRLPGLGSRFERFLDDVVGLELLRDMAEFFQAFEPLYDGFRERALEVQRLLRSDETLFALVSAPGEENNADTMFLARRLQEVGYRLGPVIVNRVHPRFDDAIAHPAGIDEGERLVRWLGERDQQGVASIRSLLPDRPLLALPMLPQAPTDVRGLTRIGADLADLV